MPPTHAAAWQNLAVAQFVRQRFDEGIASSAEALRLDPKNVAALHNLALALGQLGRWDESLAEARRGLKIRPRDPSLQALELRMRVLRFRNRLVDALRRIFHV